MNESYPDLRVTEPETSSLPELPDLMMCAYLLARETATFCLPIRAPCRPSAHPGARRHHAPVSDPLARSRAGPGPHQTNVQLEAVCHRLAEERVSKFSSVDITFETREVHLGDIEVIPTPGHTPGSLGAFASSRRSERHICSQATRCSRAEAAATL